MSFFTEQNLKIFNIQPFYNPKNPSKAGYYDRIAKVSFIYNNLQIMAHLVCGFNKKDNKEFFYIEMPGIFYYNKRNNFRGVQFHNYWINQEINDQFQNFMRKEIAEKFPDAMDKEKMTYIPKTRSQKNRARAYKKKKKSE